MKAIDSSAIAKYLNKEENWESVERALQGGCVSLDLAVKEAGNSVWKRVHRGLLDGKKAQRLFAEFVASRPFALAPQEELLVPAFKAAFALDMPLYDALFLALSKERGLVLVTSDPSQAGAAKKLGIEVQLV